MPLLKNHPPVKSFLISSYSTDYNSLGVHYEYHDLVEFTRMWEVCGRCLTVKN